MTSSTTLFRSEKMSLIHLYIPFEDAPSTLTHLGEFGVIEFNDLNKETKGFSKSFVEQIKKLSFSLKLLTNFYKELEEHKINPVLIDNYGLALSINDTEMETVIKNYDKRLEELNSSYKILFEQHLDLTDKMEVLKSAKQFFSLAKRRGSEIYNTSEDRALLLESGDLESLSIENLNLGYLTGVIDSRKLYTFEKILWRSLRGNLIFASVEIKGDDKENKRSVFIVFVYGQHFINKIKKVCEAMKAKLYSVSDKHELRLEEERSLRKRIQDLKEVLANTKKTLETELHNIASNIDYWQISIKKQKHVYECMNMFNYDEKRKCLIAEGWCPSYGVDEIKNILKGAAESSMSSMGTYLTVIPTNAEPPTFNKTNKFTKGFQEIVNSYGIAKYGEVNPGLFTIISFPFLFAVMFGDFGHGIIMLCAALYLVSNESTLSKKKYGEIFKMMFDGRYIILLMSVFSMFTGLIYNDVFSRSVSIFSSGWKWDSSPESGTTLEARFNGVYPFGLDPAWHSAENNLIFTNSYKMKMSVILGVIQMTFGIILTTFNYRHFKKRYSIWLEFVPQILFMQCIFGYLCFTIILKWSTNWFAVDSNNMPLYNSPPGLLNMLIYMFLQPGQVNEQDKLFSGQGTIQALLLAVALICVPIMLFGKPLYLKAERARTKGAGYSALQNESTASEDNTENNPITAGTSVTQMKHEEAFDFGEIMIHQIIHTIEFCLGCISNTASYLRLWALSLAHAQLSLVLWDMTIATALEMKGAVMIIALIIMGALWFVLTVAILLVMEGLSAFLHALRLHWVEFNNKFYDGTGRRFMPFHFQRMFDEEEE